MFRYWIPVAVGLNWLCLCLQVSVHSLFSNFPVLPSTADWFSPVPLRFPAGYLFLVPYPAKLRWVELFSLLTLVFCLHHAWLRSLQSEQQKITDKWLRPRRASEDSRCIMYSLYRRDIWPTLISRWKRRQVRSVDFMSQQTTFALYSKANLTLNRSNLVRKKRRVKIAAVTKAMTILSWLSSPAVALYVVVSLRVLF